MIMDDNLRKFETGLENGITHLKSVNQPTTLGIRNIIIT